MGYSTIDDIENACYAYLKEHESIGEKWGMHYHFYYPASTKYGHHQWLWDSGFHMITWSYRDVQNSIADLRTMLQFQRHDGFIPEMVFWGTESKTFLAKLFNSVIGYSSDQYTDITQMPMLPYAVRAIWNATNDVTLLEEFVPKIVAYFDWWEITRDPDGDGLVSIIHPWESGIDASPLYDPVHAIKPKNQGKFWKTYPKFLLLLHAYRKAGWNIPKILAMEKFNVEDVGVCSVYAAGWGVLAKLASEYDQYLAARCRDKQHFFEKAIVKKCWDEKNKRFISYFHLKGEERVSMAETVQSLFPLLLETIPDEMLEAVLENLQNPEKFLLSYPIPSVAKSEPSFNPNRNRLLWRGTTWPIDQWFVMEGLINHGRENIAQQLLESWIDLYKKHGIWEYYNPLTGEGLGEEGIGMSTVIVDMIKRLNVVD
ncbi:MAG TPA: trehalase family glycosidase [Candidatus Lokiarchaeia archaeon]|nr:trehalase family glycosidase [Candidatus Lokiarchaeia archaeon]